MHKGIWTFLLLVVSIGFLLLSGYLFYSAKTALCKEHSPTWEELHNSLNSDYEFKPDNYYKIMATQIYNYRLLNEYKKEDPGFVIIFKPINKNMTIPAADQLNDFTLHKLATCGVNDFSRLINFIPIFNHPRYVECIKSYNIETKTFTNNLREFILHQVLQINTAPITENQSIGLDDHVMTVIPILQTQIPKYSDEDLYKVLTKGL